MSEHTKTPWVGRRMSYRGAPDRIVIMSEGERTIAEVGLWHDISQEQEANAEFIVKAVNSHDQLVEAVKAGIARIESLTGEHPHKTCSCTYCTMNATLKAIGKDD